MEGFHPSRSKSGSGLVRAMDPAEQVEGLLAVVRERRPAFLMAVSEYLLTAINARRAEFEQYTRPLFAPQHILEQAFDKSCTLQIAESLGIPIPKSHPVASPADVERAAAACRYPVVLKPPQAYTGADAEKLDFRYQYLNSAEELKEWVRKVAELADQARRTYLFFNNCHAGQAARNAKLMQELLRQQGLPA